MSDERREFSDRRAGQSALEVKIDMIIEDSKELRNAVSTLVQAVSRLAVVEERQTQSTATQERVFSILEKLETRVSKLEEVAVTSKQTNNWVAKALWAAGAAAVGYMAKKVGLL